MVAAARALGTLNIEALNCGCEEKYTFFCEPEVKYGQELGCYFPRFHCDRYRNREDCTTAEPPLSLRGARSCQKWCFDEITHEVLSLKLDALIHALKCNPKTCAKADLCFEVTKNYNENGSPDAHCVPKRCGKVFNHWQGVQKERWEGNVLEAAPLEGFCNKKGPNGKYPKMVCECSGVRNTLQVIAGQGPKCDRKNGPCQDGPPAYFVADDFEKTQRDACKKSKCMGCPECALDNYPYDERISEDYHDFKGNGYTVDKGGGYSPM
jgi:hypothetical protein